MLVSNTSSSLDAGSHSSTGFPAGASVKEPVCQCKRHRDAGSIPKSGRFPGGGQGSGLWSWGEKNWVQILAFHFPAV